MKSRRAFLATGVASVVSGCLRGIGGSAYLEAEAHTVKKDENVISPSISVIDGKISSGSTASVQVSLQNKSSSEITFLSLPQREMWLGSPQSNNGQLTLTEANNATYARSSNDRELEGGLCWREGESTTLNLSGAMGYNIPASETERRQYSLVTARNSDCLDPGKYLFNSEYRLGSGATEWEFEITLRDIR